MERRFILLYSKYSHSSQSLITKLPEEGIITSVCIDSKDIRQRVVNDKKLNVSVVPTILIVYKTGVVEKYEGAKAHQLVDELYPVPKPPAKISFETEPIEETKVIEAPPEQKQEPKPKPEPVAVKEQASTDIDNLLDLDDENKDDESKPSTSENEEDKNDPRAKGENLPVKPTSKIGALAAEMMKQRNAMDEKNTRQRN